MPMRRDNTTTLHCMLSEQASHKTRFEPFRSPDEFSQIISTLCHSLALLAYYNCPFDVTLDTNYSYYLVSNDLSVNLSSLVLPLRPSHRNLTSRRPLPTYVFLHSAVVSCVPSVLSPNVRYATNQIVFIHLYLLLTSRYQSSGWLQI